MLHAATPVLIVDAIGTARRHYCDGLGFRELSAYRVDPERADPAYLVLERDHAVIHVSSFPGDGTAGGHASIRVDDVDALHAELASRGRRDRHVSDGPGLGSARDGREGPGGEQDCVQGTSLMAEAPVERRHSSASAVSLSGNICSANKRRRREDSRRTQSKRSDSLRRRMLLMMRNPSYERALRVA